MAQSKVLKKTLQPFTADVDMHLVPACPVLPSDKVQHDELQRWPLIKSLKYLLSFEDLMQTQTHDKHTRQSTRKNPLHLAFGYLVPLTVPVRT